MPPTGITSIVESATNLPVIIEGAMSAAIEAQIKSSLGTIKFIKEIGFDADGNLITVPFTYTKDSQTRTLSVPLITLVQVPSINIDKVEVNFKTKIHEIERTEFSASLQLDLKYKSPCFKASLSAQAKYATGTEVQREFSLDLTVLASQQDQPKGLAKILEVYEKMITDN